MLDRDDRRDEGDPFESLILDEDFVKGGVHEPPARTRDAIARLAGKETSWRHPLQPGSVPISSGSRPRWTVRPFSLSGRTARSRRGARPLDELGISWVFVLLVAVFAVCAMVTWSDRGFSLQARLAVFGFVFSGWLVSLSFHEFAHAAVAYLGGDRSVAIKGYLRLDIRRYANPVLSFILPALFVLLGGIGLPGGAVWIDKSSLRSRHWRSFTSLAGPAANILCAAACLVPFAIMHGGQLVGGRHVPFWAAVAFLGLLQCWAALLNLLPVPGLDGWGAIEPYLPEHVAESGRRLSPFGIMIVFFVVMSSPSISGRISNLLGRLEGLFSVPYGLASWGYQLMRFWSKI